MLQDFNKKYIYSKETFDRLMLQLLDIQKELRPTYYSLKNIEHNTDNNDIEDNCRYMAENIEALIDNIEEARIKYNSNNK